VKRLLLFAALGAALGAVLALAGCDRMANQPKLRGFTEPFGSDLAYPLVPPAGTVATDDKLVHPPPPVTLALLQRGRERFDIYCAPCHGYDGRGDGMIVRRGFPTPPSYHTERLREAPIQHFYDVITNGYGVMFSYAARVAPSDRWAIIAYIRALQASTMANLTDVPPEIRQTLQ
jgi:mono/diheme cytochrome c family protein